MHSTTRRQFLGTLLAAPCLARAGEPRQPRGPTLGFNTYGMKTLSTEQALRELAKIGFDSIELDCGPGCDAEPAKLDAARRRDVRQVAADCALWLTTLQGMPTPTVNDATHAQGMERLKTLAQLAHDLCPEEPLLIEAGLGGRDPWDKMRPLFERRVADWLKVAEAADVHLVVKPHRDTSMDRPEQGVQLIQELGSPARLQLSYDFSHFALRDMTMEETIRIALPWTGFVAIKDVALENGRTAFKLPGETHVIDYPALVRQFHAGGYRGDYNCEVSSMIFRKPGFDCLAAARLSYANIAPAFEAAGVKRVRRG